MKVSMNGLRRSLTNSLNELNIELKELLEHKDHYIKERVSECFNDVVSEVGLLNCVFNEQDPDFVDMSENLSLLRLGEET